MNTIAKDTFEDDYHPPPSGPVFANAKSRFDPTRILDSIKRVATVSEALRILGAAVLLASMSLFLLQGWSEGNDIRRYLLLLGQTGLLAVAGFGLSHGLKEAKGARLFFGLALVSIPANFTILGALVYSLFQWDGALTTYPDYATWQILDVANIGITFAGAMLVLLPVTLFSFAIMARHSAKALSLHFFALNAMLLLPVRSSLVAGVIALFGVAYALAVVRRVTQKDRALKTPEGRFAIGTLFIPAGIILFRSTYFYSADALMVAMVTLAIFLAFRQASLLPGRNSRIALALEILSVPIGLVFALACASAFGDVFGWAFTAVAFSLAYTLTALDIVRRTESRFLAKAIGVSVSLLVAVSFLLSVSGTPSALQAVACVVAGALLFAGGVVFRAPTASVAGLVTVVGGTLFGLDAMLAIVLASSWIDLALFGACAIAAGSILERHGVAIKMRMTHWFGPVVTEEECDEVIALEN